MEKLLGLDIGTTHCKAGLFSEDGSPIRFASAHTPTRHQPSGYRYDPDELWNTVVALIREVVGLDSRDVTSVGIASMAEAGLLIDRTSGEPLSPVIPWFDRGAVEQSAELERVLDPYESFRVTGLRPSYKYGLCKILWLRDRAGLSTSNALWLSVADYIAFRLTGVTATDPTLAARTYAYDIARKRWDVDRVRVVGPEPDLFPEVLPSGRTMGGVSAEGSRRTNLLAGTPVAIAGHDHICAAYAMGATEPGEALDSMGTAETLIGALGSLRLGEEEFRSGLAFGPHVLEGRYFWLGALSASGASVDWILSILSDPPLTYEQAERLQLTCEERPTGVLYFPYLFGSGAPNPDQLVQAAFVGLESGSDRGRILTAVLEGTAYEMESVRRAAGSITGRPIRDIAVAGGGAKNPVWMEIKADVYGMPLRVSDVPEAVLLGAAMLAAHPSHIPRVQGGTREDTHVRREAAACTRSYADRTRGCRFRTVRFDPERHARYGKLYESGYMPLQEPLRRYFQETSSNEEGDKHEH